MTEFSITTKQHLWSLFLHTLTSTIKLEYALFYQLYAKIYIFAVKECLVRLLSMMLTLKHLAEK